MILCQAVSPKTPNEIIGTELCHRPRGLYLANILSFAPKLALPYKLFKFYFLNDFMYVLTIPSQKYYRPDLTYVSEAAESYSK